MMVQLRFFRERGKQIFKSFQQDKHLLERELKIPLSWSDGTQPMIAAAKKDVSIKDPLDWLEQHEWITATLLKFSQVFYERLVSMHSAIKEKSESKQLLLDFWLGFHRYLYEHGNTLLHNSAQSCNNNDFPTGRSAFWYAAVVAPTTKRLTVGLMLGSEVSRPAWPKLVEEREAIESAIGSGLEWNCPADQKIWTVKVNKNDTPLDDRERWNESYDWLFKYLKAFDSAFRNRISALQLDDISDESISTADSPNTVDSPTAESSR